MRKTKVEKENEQSLLNSSFNNPPSDEKCSCCRKCTNRCKFLICCSIITSGLFILGGINIYMIETDGSNSDFIDFLPSF